MYMKAEASRPKGCEVIGEGVPFERIRRITGYLVGTLDRFNDAKRAEVYDRVKHASVGSCPCCDGGGHNAVH